MKNVPPEISAAATGRLRPLDWQVKIANAHVQSPFEIAALLAAMSTAHQLTSVCRAGMHWRRATVMPSSLACRLRAKHAVGLPKIRKQCGVFRGSSPVVGTARSSARSLVRVNLSQLSSSRRLADREHAGVMA
jgi:hypothetical protein